MTTPILQVDGVEVRFGGVVALDGVHLSADSGEVTGLIGPNGAGKTTCFNVITGIQAAAAGTVLLDGVDMARVKPHKRARLGIARTFQRLEVFGSLSVHHNVLVAAEARLKNRRDGSDPTEVTNALLRRIGIEALAGWRVAELPTGTMRLVELARALATDPRILLLDEPASGLTEAETATLGRLLRSLADDGLAILVVEHDVEFVTSLCRRIHVFDFGRLLAIGSPTEIRQDPLVQAAYLGVETGSAVA